MGKKATSTEAVYHFLNPAGDYLLTVTDATDLAEVAMKLARMTIAELDLLRVVRAANDPNGLRLSELLETARRLPRLGRANKQFTKRESDVMEQLMLSRCNKEIANQLGISLRTVKFHVSNLLLKTGTSTRHELTRFYRAISQAVN